MHCSTSLEIKPMIPHLPRGLVLLLVLSLLVRACCPALTAQPKWLPVIPVHQGGWQWRKIGQWCMLRPRWCPLLLRLLARCALLGVLLHTSGWVRVTPLSWVLLFLPTAQVLTRGRSFARSKRLYTWRAHMQRLYQLTVLALVVSTLAHLVCHLRPRPTGIPFSVFLGTWRTQPDCIIRAMSTGDSDECRPPVPGHADHLFQWHGVHFSGDTGISGRLGLDSVDDMPGTRGRLHRNTQYCFLGSWSDDSTELHRRRGAEPSMGRGV